MVGEKIGPYRVIERLGGGGMSSVYRALDESSKRDVALKILDETTGDSAARLRAEAAALSRLNHQGVPSVYELLEADGRLVLAMELISGQTLQHLLDHIGVLSPRQAAELCMQTLDVLEHAHAAGIVHRDLKPTNLMLTDNGAIKVMDFGIARMDDSVNLTHAGVMVGTPAYMPPEQVLGHPIDGRTDLYSMGVVFFRLLTDALPFAGETPFEMAQSHLNDAPARATEVRQDLPAWVNEILTRALAKDPAGRFQTAAEFRAALNDASASTPESGAAAGVESTEVLTRPHQLSTQPTAAATVDHARPRKIALTAAATVLISAAWALVPIGGSSAASASAYAITPTVKSSKPVAAAAAAPRKTESIIRMAAAPSSAPSTATPARAIASFGQVKFLAVNGSRTSAADVFVHLSDREVSFQYADYREAAASLPYQRIAKATYAQGRDPVWDPTLSGPSGKIDVPGFIGRAKHWLVLQGKDRYVILRLDGDDRLDVMRAFENRTGIVIDRPASTAK